MELLEGRAYLSAVSGPADVQLAASYGLIGPIGPQSNVTAPAGAIHLRPTMTDAQIDSLVSSSGAGATFFIEAGTYRDVDIRPRDNQKFLGALGAVFTSLTKEHAFVSSASGVTVENLVIDGYVPTFQNASLDAADHWTIDHVEVRGSAAAGIQVGSFSTIRNSSIHDCAQIGIKAVDTASGGTNCQSVTVTNSRISHNDPLNQFDYGVEGGGSKFWNVSGLTVTHCEFDNNVGDGIWCDGDLAGGNRNVEIAYNWTHDNNRYGIYQEIGGSFWIHDNLTENNGIAGPYHEADGDGIQVNNSESGLIENNSIRNNYNSLSMASYERPDTTHKLQNITVRNNEVSASRGVFGVYNDGPLSFNNPYSGSITFDNNAYHFWGTATFDWNGQWIGWNQWRGFGMDLHGTFSTGASIVGRRLFYNQSGATLTFDHNDASINAFDDAAIAADKQALLPGAGAATFANVSSYSKGINGIMIDLAGPHGTITSGDFIFKLGNNNSPSTWAAAPAPSGFSVRAGAGAGGADRVEMTWANGAITKTWLEVVTKANADTDLPQSPTLPAGQADAFFFGNSVGGSGLGDNATTAPVNATDEVAARSNPATLIANIPPTNLFDFNRDGQVNSTDQIIARLNPTGPANVLKFIAIAAGPVAPDAAPQAPDASMMANVDVAAADTTYTLASQIARGGSHAARWHARQLVFASEDFALAAQLE